jgi:hypothetical protein
MVRELIKIVFLLFILIIINPSGTSKPILGGGNEPSDKSTVTVITTTGSVGSSEGAFVPTSGSISTAPRPKDEPSFGAIPSEPPAASTGSTKPYLYHGEGPSMDDLRSLGGEVKAEGSIKYYVLYNNKWCTGSMAFWLNDKTNSLSYVDISQYITYFEKYPDGEVTITDWGYMRKGFHPAWFSADEKGWHRVAIWGSESGWSSVVWIYVH